MISSTMPSANIFARDRRSCLNGSTTHRLSGRVSEAPTLFRRPGCEKVAPAGQFEAGGGVCNLPCMTDGLSTPYQDLLAGSYDCADRIVLNPYFCMGHNPGGFRVC